MKDLSVGALISWEIAAIETAGAKYQYIEKEQICIGLLSIEKLFLLGGLEFRFPPQALEAMQKELKALNDVMTKFNLDSTKFRRKIREQLGEGNYKHTEKVIHRSEACKIIFAKADELARVSDHISILHLFAAILEYNDGIIFKILREYNIDHDQLKDRALKQAFLIGKEESNDNYFI